MPIRIPNVGEERMLGFMLGKTAMETFQLRLYSNNITPADTDTATTYTQVTGAGYAAVNLTAANWVITPGDPTVAAYPQVTFSFTAGFGNVYGYYLVGGTSGVLLWSERFTDGPYNVAASGDSIRITPRITFADTLDV